MSVVCQYVGTVKLVGKIELIDDLETSLIEGMSESGFNSKKLG